METKHARMSIQELAGGLLCGNEVAEDVASNCTSKDAISVMDSAPEISNKRKRGRPPAGSAVMTAAERSRRYRDKKRPAWKKWRVEVCGLTMARAEKIAAESGAPLDLVFFAALLKAPLDLAQQLKATHMKAENAPSVAHEDAA